MPSSAKWITCRATALVLIVLMAAPVGLHAQAPSPAVEPPTGFSRVQGLTEPNSPLLPPQLLGPTIDYREEMRTFVQGIATYARSQSPGFLVVVRDAEELIIKRDLQDDNLISPARTLMRSIDGVMFDGVFVGDRVFGAPLTAEQRAPILDRIERAKRGGLRVFIQDFTSDRNTIDQIFRAAGDIDAVASVAHRPLPDLTDLPPYPVRPNMENPNNILSLSDVNNYVYIADPSGFGRQDQFAFTIHDTNYDLIIVDPFIGRDPLSRPAIERMKFKKLGARRLVFARVDIASAASYHFYWQQGWQEGIPSWIEEPFPGDPDRYFVEYWSPAWQQIIFGNPNSYIFGLIAQGYDGVVLEGMNNYLAFEGNVEISTEFAPMSVATQ